MKLDIRETGPLSVNTYILKDEESKEAVIIDVGGDFDELYNELKQEGYSLKFILNTHGHFDHVLGETEVSVKYPEIPIYMHKDDLPHLERCKQEIKAFGYDIDAQPPKITDFIDENSDLKIGKNQIQIFHTPGHSKGSLSYYIDNKLFTGDALFFRSIGRTDFYDGDFDTLINSIKTKLLTLNENTQVFPGHGPSTSIRDEKLYNAWLK